MHTGDAAKLKKNTFKNNKKQRCYTVSAINSAAAATAAAAVRHQLEAEEERGPCLSSGRPELRMGITRSSISGSTNFF